MLGSLPKPSNSSNKEKEWFAVSFKPENLLPGLIIGFLFGMFFDLTKPSGCFSRKNVSAANSNSTSKNTDEELKMVLVVRQDLKMGTGKIASQCAHAATGMYSELLQRGFSKAFDFAEQFACQRLLLRRWEQCGQAKIVVTCKSLQEMSKLKETAESIGLPTFVVADAGRTQVSAGSKTVLAIGPGKKSAVDSVTGKQRLLS